MTDELALPLPPSGVEWSSTHLQVLDPNLPFETVEGLFAAASALGDAARWILGDILLFAESRFGEEYAQLLDAGRVSERQLRRYRYVAERVRPVRRRTNLSFSHHEEVAQLEPNVQERLLRRAADGQLSIREIRDLVADEKALAPPGTAPSQPRFEVLDSAVGAAREVAATRQTLSEIGAGLEPETAEALGVHARVRGMDEVGRVLRRVDLLEEVVTAARSLHAAGVPQTGLATPAVIAPMSPWETLGRTLTKLDEGGDG